jgi:hypothetical protein
MNREMLRLIPFTLATTIPVPGASAVARPDGVIETRLEVSEVHVTATSGIGLFRLDRKSVV